VAVLEGEAGVTFPHITEAREFTRKRLSDVAAELGGLEVGESSICLFGSWARQELTEGSDDDWAVVALERFADYEPGIVRTMAAAQAVLGTEDRAPGKQGVFGVPFDVETLVQYVGLDQDTNTNLTRRMLLLLESTELVGTIHDAACTSVLTRYLNYGVKDYRPPRFLLNDLIRYWRTICVDFEGKHADTQGDDPKWVSRNAKLRTSRKLLFAGGLIPILLCHLYRREQMQAFLKAWFRAPPLDRLAAGFRWAGATEEGVRALRAYDAWLAIQLDTNAREELERLRLDTREDSPLFREIRDIGNRFDRSLLALLLTQRLAPLALPYVIF
jgi:predicted nucleotidyltransferase